MYGIVQDFGRGALDEEALIGPRALSGVRPTAFSTQRERRERVAGVVSSAG